MVEDWWNCLRCQLVRSTRGDYNLYDTRLGFLVTTVVLNTVTDIGYIYKWSILCTIGRFKFKVYMLFIKNRFDMGMYEYVSCMNMIFS